MKSRGTRVRELAWTVSGASAGALVRYWVDQMWPDTGHALAATVVLTATAAAVVGFALVASIPQPMKTVVIAAGGAAGSISALAAQTAVATPAQSLIGLPASLVGAVGGVLLGMLVALSVLRDTQREERR